MSGKAPAVWHEETTMLALEQIACEPKYGGVLEAGRLLAEERDFYKNYYWSLNPHLTVREAIENLGDQVAVLPLKPRSWQSGEVATNVYLLSCALLNSIDEYLRGPNLRLPSRLASMRIGRMARWAVETGSVHRRPPRGAHVRRWRERWVFALDNFLSVLVVMQPTCEPASFREATANLAAVLKTSLPASLLDERISVPSPFRRLDLTHHDLVTLAERYAQQFPDRSQPILLVGLRTSGSYFVPFLRACLVARGFEAVSALTFAPSKGAGRRERQELRRYATQGYSAVVVDDPPHTGGAILTALEIVGKAGFHGERMRVLVPTHRARRHVFENFPEEMVVTLKPEDWHKCSLLTPEMTQRRLSEYFGARNFTNIAIVESECARALNASLEASVSDERSARLKRIFEVKLTAGEGDTETRYVLAKSVGWGWLGYHAFLAGQALSDFVPPVLGLRDGILYMEWIPHSPFNDDDDPRRANARIDTAAAYIAARTRNLSLVDDSITGKEPPRQNNGTKLLREVLSKAYGIFPANILARPGIGRSLREQPCPRPTLIDANMGREEWVAGPAGLLKTDYEHHGLGKEELNVIDPAYDLADTILNWQLSTEQESRFIQQYIRESGDTGVEDRLPLNKLLAGLWSMKRAHELLLGKAAVVERQQVFHRRFLSAWDFLTVQMARYCGRQCRLHLAPRWRSPLVATDIDGVLDRRIFGFPSTSVAGIKALSTLHAHGFTLVVNTARSVSEVKSYCEAYGLAGGVAEHGSYIWDAVNGCGHSLISPEAAVQLDELRRHLQQLPGVFLDDRHQFSIRTFAYHDKPRGFKRKIFNYIRSSGIGDSIVGPVPELLIRHLMAKLNLDLLSYHHTEIDTAIVAKNVNKGTGLLALRDWVLNEDAETVAIGDQAPDLTMFRVATHSFAPANIGCKREARLIGCQVVGQSFQKGMLEIADRLTRLYAKFADGHVEETAALTVRDDLLTDLLQIADQPWGLNLRDSVLDLIFSNFRSVRRPGPRRADIGARRRGR